MSNWASRSLAKAIWPGPTSGGGAWDSLHAEEVSTAARSQKKAVADSATALSLPCLVSVHDGIGHDVLHRIHRLVVHPYLIVQVRSQDRKSTRLNSSHGYISYAVFCLKKKKTQQRT